jgi:hypothetical protein
MIAMLQSLLICTAFLMVQDSTKPVDDPQGTVKSVQESNQAEAAALAEYNTMRDQVAETGAAHWKMAQWCEQKGLKPEAYFHYGRVIELEPQRAAAWQKLGFKKHDGRWMTDRQITVENALKKTDKDWASKLKKWHKEIHRGKKQAEAQAALDAIVDAASVPSVYREFCGGSSNDQSIGIQILGQIEGPIASKAILVLAIYGKSANVRRIAAELLRNRPTEEYLDLLVSLMKDLLKYEVKPVGGPGSPGILFVEGERFNARRFYAPPPPATYIPRVGDLVTYDANGLPVITRSASFISAAGPKVGVPGSKTLVNQNVATTTETDTFSYSNALVEAQRAAMSAQAQLTSDIAQLDAINEGITKFNEQIMQVARNATGKNPGRTAKDWRDLLALGKDARYVRRPQSNPKLTINQMVPLDYLPDLSQAITRQMQTNFLTMTVVDT